ncbi:MAG: exo-alpha-sialidase [Flavobacteriales bacterium]|nr:exo-alpha-sialidase [Flavobacteriales bacterium]
MATSKNGVKLRTMEWAYINKLYKSTNQGSSWTEVGTTGLTNLGNVHSLTISGNTMILGGMDVNSANGAKIFTSTDNGVSWTLSMTGFDQTYSPADFVTASNGDIYVNGVKYDNGISGFINKFYKSTNQGSSWTEVGTTGLTNLGNVHSLTISANTMILGGMDVNSANGAKIFTSTDNGASWTLSMTGFDQTYSPADFVTASNEDIYVNGVKYDNGISGFINKLYKSTNQGSSWTEVTTTGLTNLGNVHSLTISGNTMILGGMDVNSANGAKIFTSNYSGSTADIREAGLTNIVNAFPNPFTDEIQITFAHSPEHQPKSITLFSVNMTTE